MCFTSDLPADDADNTEDAAEEGEDATAVAAESEAPATPLPANTPAATPMDQNRQANPVHEDWVTSREGATPGPLNGGH